MIAKPLVVNIITIEWYDYEPVTVFHNDADFHFTDDQLSAFMSGMVYAAQGLFPKRQAQTVHIKALTDDGTVIKAIGMTGVGYPQEMGA